MASINLSQLINESLMVESENEENSSSEDSGSRLKSALDWGRNKYDSAKQKVQAFGENHPKVTKGLKYGSGVAAGTAALGGAAYLVKKGLDRHRASKAAAAAAAEAQRNPMNQAKAFATKHGKKVAAGTLAALGAGVGVKALLKYLRKKKS